MNRWEWQCSQDLEAEKCRRERRQKPIKELLAATFLREKYKSESICINPPTLSDWLKASRKMRNQLGSLSTTLCVQEVLLQVCRVGNKNQKNCCLLFSTSSIGKKKTSILLPGWRVSGGVIKVRESDNTYGQWGSARVSGGLWRSQLQVAWAC